MFPGLYTIMSFIVSFLFCFGLQARNNWKKTSNFPLMDFQISIMIEFYSNLSPKLINTLAADCTSMRCQILTPVVTINWVDYSDIGNFGRLDNCWKCLAIDFLQSF